VYGTFVTCTSNESISVINADIGYHSLVCSSSELGDLVTGTGIENSDEGSFLGSSDKHGSILTQLHHSQSAIMCLDFYGFLFLFKSDHLDVPYLFIRDCQHADLFLHRQSHKPIRIFASDEAVSQIEVLEVVNIDFVF
jgi:hypothetical protein